MSYIWYPSREMVEESNVQQLLNRLKMRDYRDFIKRSVEDIGWFWGFVEKELNVEWFKPYSKVYDTSRGVEWTEWYIGGEINVVHNILDRHASSSNRNNLAFTWVGEDGSVSYYTYLRLFKESNRLANFLKGIGVSKGDVVATYLPMLPETIVTLMATLKIGAVFMPIFSGFGVEAIATRLQDAKPKAVVTVDAYYRRGSKIKIKHVLDAAEEKAGINPVNIIVKRMNVEIPINEEGRDVYFSDAVRRESAKCDTEGVKADDPALLLYTSGTTGKPKGAVISHAGALLKPASEHFINFDIKPGDTLMWITDIGWMMGPWQIIGTQHLGASHLIFEGAFDYPSPDRIWKMIEEHHVTHLGFSATVVRILKRYGEEYAEAHDLSSLKALGNTGEPIDPDSWMWAVQRIGGERIPLINISGGTEIFGCFLLPSTVVPLKPSTLWGPAPGMDVDVFNEEGRPVRGEVGYLVCRKPAPSMTRGFWNDPQRYLDTYWSRFPGVWYHGDWASVDEDGFWYLHGRADDTIKVAGRRVGPAEIESVVNSHPEVAESACIGIPHEIKGEEILCFIKLKGEKQSIPDEVKKLVEEKLGKTLVPKEVIPVPDLPRTRSGKIMRRLIRRIITDEPLGDLSSLENPESLEAIRAEISKRLHSP